MRPVAYIYTCINQGQMALLWPHQPAPVGHGWIEVKAWPLYRGDEIEVLRKDAERYRWLRENAQQDVDGWRNDVPVLVHALSYVPEWKGRIDESIDAAMSMGEQS